MTRYFKAADHLKGGHYELGKTHRAWFYDNFDCWGSECQRAWRNISLERLWHGRPLPVGWSGQITCSLCLKRDEPPAQDFQFEEQPATTVKDFPDKHCYQATFFDGYTEGEVLCPSCRSGNIHPSGYSQPIRAEAEYSPKIGVFAWCECGALLQIALGNYKGDLGIDVDLIDGASTYE